LETFILVVVFAHFPFIGPLFYLLFSKVSKLFSSDLQFRLTIYIWGLGLGIRFKTSRFGFRLTFKV